MMINVPHVSNYGQRRDGEDSGGVGGVDILVIITPISFVSLDPAMIRTREARALRFGILVEVLVCVGDLLDLRVCHGRLD